MIFEHFKFNDTYSNAYILLEITTLRVTDLLATRRLARLVNSVDNVHLMIITARSIVYF